MCQLLEHRGPDGSGVLYRPPISLGHTRLRIIDLVSGDQPLCNEDSTVWVTFNGEIYNFQELRSRLVASGHEFRTRSDTEVIVHLYEEFDLNFVQHLRGMFAFALWDERKQRLVIARDRIGKKPLYYANTGHSFVFASELKALLGSGQSFPQRLDPDAVNQYLTYGYVSAPQSIVQGIKKLPPAHLLTVDSTGRERLERYWSLEFAKNKQSASLSEVAVGVRNALVEATRLRMTSDVPIGFFLSGGIDSSAIVASAAQIGGGTLRTFSIGFNEESFNELPYARIVADRFGTDHQELTVTAEMTQDLEEVIRAGDEPLSDPSMVPTYYLAKLTREHTKVVLGGDGGDEAFGGYERYAGIRLAAQFNRIPFPMRRFLIAPIAGLLPESSRKRDTLRRLKRFFYPAVRTTQERYFSWMYQFPPSQRISAYTPWFNEMLTRSLGECDTREAFISALVRDPVSAAQSFDTMTYLPGDLMLKADRMTMAHGLELRSPFLDHELLQYAATIPSSMKVRGMSLKVVLKKAFEGLLPPEILHRPKAGFSVPFALWLREELRGLTSDVLLAPNATVHAFVRRTAVEEMIREHQSGTTLYALRIWNLLCLEVWCQAFGVSPP